MQRYTAREIATWIIRDASKTCGLIRAGLLLLAWLAKVKRDANTIRICLSCNDVVDHDERCLPISETDASLVLCTSCTLKAIEERLDSYLNKTADNNDLDNALDALRRLAGGEGGAAKIKGISLTASNRLGSRRRAV